MGKRSNRQRTSSLVQEKPESTACEIARLPVGHLRLSARARHATAKFKDIGRLFNSWASGGQTQWRPAVHRELDFVLGQLEKVLTHTGFKYWDEFSRSRPQPGDLEGGSSLYFMSPSLRRLKPAVAEEHLGQLHLKVRSINALECSGVYTIGQLIERSEKGLTHLACMGKGSTTDVRTALEALASSVDHHGDVDWIHYAGIRGFAILPTLLRPDWSPPNFVEYLPGVLDAVTRIQYNRRDSQIIRNRFLKKQYDRSTFRNLGSRFSRTRQRIGMVEEDFVKMLRRVIWLCDYRACLFRFRSEYLAPLRALAARLDSEGVRKFSSAEWRQLFTHNNSRFSMRSALTEKFRPRTGNKRRWLLALCWPDLLRECWGMRQSKLKGQERILLETLGFRADGHLKHRFVVADQRSAAFQSSIEEVRRLLTLVHPDGLTLRRLATKLRSKFGRNAPTIDECLQIVNSLSYVELKGRGIYRAKLEALRRITDKCERVLRAEGRPLHFYEIRSRAAIVSPNYSCPKMLGVDSRFVPIGGSGYWALAQWRIETGTIADVAAKVMAGQTRPLTKYEVFDLVRRRRPCLETSVASSLYNDRRFRKVGLSTWLLTK
jgi:hypothetical protein